MLDLHAAAFVAILDEGNTSTVRVDIGAVLGELLRHEKHLWYHSARVGGLTKGPAGLSALMLRQIVAVGALLGATTEEETSTLAGQVPGLSPSSRVANWLREVYPPGPGELDWLGSLQPDRLAELHCVRELAASPELARACLTNLDARQARRAVPLLARASSDYPQAEALLGQVLPEVADFIAGLDAPRETLVAIFNVIPLPTVILGQAAATLARQIVALLPVNAGPITRAYWLSVLGTVLSTAGRPAEALPALEEAVAVYQELAAARSERYRRYLAQSLDNLGATFFELGRPADALPVTEEAVAICRELAAASPDRYRPDLARSLTNLGVTFSELGRPADALPVTEEAVAICRELAAASPDRYRPDLARSLDNLGIWFSELGRPAEALPVTEEAVTIYRELAAASPDRYRPDLAPSLNNLGVWFSELGRPADALPVAEEAVGIYRELAAARPRPLPPRPRQLPDQPRRPVLRAGPPGRRAAGRRRKPSPSTGSWPPPTRTATAPTSPAR